MQRGSFIGASLFTISFLLLTKVELLHLSGQKIKRKTNNITLCHEREPGGSGPGGEPRPTPGGKFNKEFKLNNFKKATFRIDMKNLEGISFVQLVELQIHLAGCSICCLSQTQSQVIDQLVDRFYHTNPGTQFALDERFKEALEKNLLREVKKSILTVRLDWLMPLR